MNLKKMTNKELFDEFVRYQELIDAEPSCYGIDDICHLYNINDELHDRNLKIKTKYELAEEDD
jgi:hypothetical protein